MGAGVQVLAVGLGGVIGLHLWHLHASRAGPTRRSMPRARGGGRLGRRILRALRRTRTRNERQRDLATTIERFRSAVEALPDGMVIIDAANRIQWANARAQAHLGLDLAKDTGRPLANFVRASPRSSTISRRATSRTP